MSVNRQKIAVGFLSFLLRNHSIIFYKVFQVNDGFHAGCLWIVKKSLLRSSLRGCRSCIDSIAVRLAWSTAPQGMLKYVHRNACHRDCKGCDSAHFKGAVCCIELLSFLLIKRSVCVYKRIEVSENLQAVFWVFRSMHRQKNRSCGAPCGAVDHASTQSPSG